MKTIRFARGVTFAAGLFYVIVPLIMLAAPRWFYENVGHFPPFNRHYMGDTATFLLPLGAGLMIATRDPVRHRLIIAIGAAGSVLHTLNHLYDPLIEGMFNRAYDPILAHTTPALYWFFEFTPLLLLAAGLILAFYSRPVEITQRETIRETVT